MPGGILTPETTIGTAEAVLMVMSGKAKGLALIALPLMLVTLRVEAPRQREAR